MEPIIVTNLEEPALAVFSQLTESQLRNRLEPEKGIFIAESPKVIFRALEAGLKPVSLLMEARQLSGQGQIVIEKCPDIPVYVGERALLEQLTGYCLTRGILCAMRRPTPVPTEEILQNARRVAVLEGIVDATNIGAIFRSAAALGMDGVLLTPTCCDPLNRRAVRVSMGTVFQIPWGVLEVWPENPTLHAMGFQTAAMALRNDSHAIDDPVLTQIPKLAIVLGAEGDGLAPQTIAACDYTVKIPMSHGVDSLNVAAASAVAFWALK